MPGGTTGKMKPPELSLVAVSAALVLTFKSCISALGATAPVGSVTVPLTLPAVDVWAVSGVEANRTQNAAKSKQTHEDVNSLKSSRQIEICLSLSFSGD